MAVPEAAVARVVAAVDEAMRDPTYGQLRIGDLVQREPDASRYLAASVGKRAGGEAAMEAVFHASILLECVAAHRGAAAAPLTFPHLDEVGDDPLGVLRGEEPALVAYLEANVPEDAHEPLARVLLAASRASA